MLVVILLNAAFLAFVSGWPTVGAIEIGIALLCLLFGGRRQEQQRHADDWQARNHYDDWEARR